MASRLQDLKEQLTDQLMTQWNRFSESSLYIQVRERFEDLNSTQQKIVLAGSVLVTLFLVFSVPMSYFSSASDEIARFESLRQLTRDLLRITRTQDAPPIENIPAAVLSNKIQDELKIFRLTKEQIAKVEQIPTDKMGSYRLAPPQIQEEAVQVTLAQLNLKQIVDIGHRMANLGETLKLSALTIQANNKAGFFDMIFQVSTYSANPPKVEAPSGKRSARKRGGDE